jgi:hypothetical protein
VQQQEEARRREREREQVRERAEAPVPGSEQAAGAGGGGSAAAAARKARRRQQQQTLKLFETAEENDAALWGGSELAMDADGADGADDGGEAQKAPRSSGPNPDALAELESMGVGLAEELGARQEELEDEGEWFGDVSGDTAAAMSFLSLLTTRHVAVLTASPSFERCQWGDSAAQSHANRKQNGDGSDGATSNAFDAEFWAGQLQYCGREALRAAASKKAGCIGLPVTHFAAACNVARVATGASTFVTFEVGLAGGGGLGGADARTLHTSLDCGGGDTRGVVSTLPALAVSVVSLPRREDGAHGGTAAREAHGSFRGAVARLFVAGFPLRVARIFGDEVHAGGNDGTGRDGSGSGSGGGGGGGGGSSVGALEAICSSSARRLLLADASGACSGALLATGSSTPWRLITSSRNTSTCAASQRRSCWRAGSADALSDDGLLLGAASRASTSASLLSATPSWWRE